MKNRYKILTTILFFFFFTTFTIAEEMTIKGGLSPIDGSFNYQGELIDTGSPANGTYDFEVIAYGGLSGSSILGDVSGHPGVVVTNGLFFLDNVNLGSYADGFEIYIQINVRLQGAASYDAMSPRQKLRSTPFASNLIQNGATNGQVLTYSAAFGVWIPETPAETPWATTGSNISYSGGNVGIGTSSPAVGKLHIAYGASEHGLRITDNIGTTRLWVNNNGGTAIGLGNPPPALGLLVEGDSKQSGTANGMLKYMVKATCTSGTQAIDHSFNGTAGIGSVTVAAFDINAGACRLTFPSGSGNMTDLNNRYWVATAIGSSNRIVTCQRNAARELDCRRTFSTTGSADGGQFMVLVY